MKPLFIPLKTEFYLAFIDGTKNEEYRPEGPRWNRHTCAIGRRVVLSHGYGKADRCEGVITAFRSTMELPPGWSACYGDRPGPVACITIVPVLRHTTVKSLQRLPARHNADVIVPMAPL